MVKQSTRVPSVAIITRTKNRPQFLNRSIKTVLNQSYEDYVHVILNDGGDAAKVEAVIAQNPDSRRLVVHNETSVGLSRALNQAIKASVAKYVVILDDDDAWHVDRLKIALETMEAMGARASVVPMEIVIEDVNDGVIEEVERMPHPESWSGEVSLFKQAHRNFLSNGAIMYERTIYDELGGYDETLTTAEDWDFGIRLMLKCNVEQVIYEDALVYYHQRPSIKFGDSGNSVHAGVREQERAIMILRNNYLRKDIESGTFGIGYIMNHSEQESIYLNRIEGHVNHMASVVEDEIVGKIHADIRHFFSVKNVARGIKRSFVRGVDAKRKP